MLVSALLLLLAAEPQSQLERELTALLMQGGVKPKRYTCPVGGEVFEQVTDFPHYQLESFPDGSHPGDEWIDVELPECPGNGLVILPNYSADELKALPALVDSPEYQALRREARHLRGYWLAGKLGRSGRERFDLLIRATFGAGKDAERRRAAMLKAGQQRGMAEDKGHEFYASWAGDDPERYRYLTMLVAEGDTLLADPAMPAHERWWNRYFIVNAFRELGRFDEARERLNALADTIDHAVTADNHRAFLKDRMETMRSVIDLKDRDRRPIDLMSGTLAENTCRDLDPRTASSLTLAACAKRKLDRERREEESERAGREADGLLRNPESLAAQCQSVVEADRSQGLDIACSVLERRRDQAAAEALRKADPMGLAARCDAVRGKARDDVLDYACIEWDAEQQRALTARLVSDDAEYERLCGENRPDADDEDQIVSAACTNADMDRLSAAVTLLKQDPVKLRARCAGTPREQWDAALMVACGELDTEAKRERN